MGRHAFPLVLAVIAPMWLAFVGLIYHRHAARAGRRLGMPDSPQEAAYPGAIRSQAYGGGTGCRLEFFGWGIRMRGGLLAFLQPTFELRYEEIEEARLTASRVNRGVRFRAACLRGPVTFVTFGDAEIAERLEERGVPVNREVGRLNWMVNKE